MSYIRLNWKRKGEQDYIFGPEQLSDGSLRFIALAVLLLSPPDLLPNVIVIGESSYARLNEEELSDWLDDYSVSQLWEKNLLGGGP